MAASEATKPSLGAPELAILGAVQLVSTREIKPKTIIVVFKGFIVTPVLIKTVI
jgi:hypothetical protein